MIMCLQKLNSVHPLKLNQILMSIKGVTLLQICEKMTLYNPNTDLANANVYTKFG